MTATVRADQAQIEAGAAKLSALLARSATDSSFRHQLLTSPREAVQEYTGNAFPENYRIEFIENRGGPTIVLPPFVEAQSELSESELEAVAGGSEPVTTVLLSVAVAVGSAVISAEGALWLIKMMQ